MALMSSIIPGLTDDVAELCLSRIPRSSFRTVSQVCRRWRSFLGSEHFVAVRKSTGMVEKFLCVLMETECRREMYWEVFDDSGNKLGQIPPVPGPVTKYSRVVVLDGKKIVFIEGGHVTASADVHEFDPASNRWKKLASMNQPRFCVAVAEVEGLLYVIGGSTGIAEETYAEVYNPKTNRWSLIDCPNHLASLASAFSFNSKLYAIAIGKGFIYVYDPRTKTWEELKWRNSLFVYSLIVVRNKVYFADWRPRYMGEFDPEAHSWRMLFVPRRDGLSSTRLGLWNDNILLFPQEPGHETLIYDFDEDDGPNWRVCDQIQLSGSHLANVLINF